MSQLVLAMYIADICNSLCVCVRAGCFTAFVAFVACLAAFIIIRVEHIGNFYSKNSSKIHRRLEKFWLFWAQICGTALAVLFVVNALMPSDRTLYTYIGIEATQTISQQVADSPRIQKILDLVDAKLDETLEEKKKK